MLFIVNKPTNLIFTPANRIVITTHKQLILTQLDFIEEFLSAALTHTHPIHLAHSHHTSQTLVGTGSSLQLYWSDWVSKIELRMLVVLNNQMVQSIQFDSVWVAYGNFKQYSSKKIKLYRLDNIDHDHLTCYVGSKQFIVSSTKLIMYEHKTHKRKYIQWHDAKHHTNHIYQHKLTLQAWKIYDEQYIIQAGGTMIYFNDREVLRCIENEGNLVVSGKIAAWFNFGKMHIYEINQHSICDLGEINSYDGHYYGSILQDKKLNMFFYDFKELMVKTVNLISQPPHSQSIKQKQEKSEIKNQISSPMPQIRQSNGSQQSLANLIEQMTELKRQPFNSSISKHNISRMSIQKALKESISKFQSQLNRSLSQQQKFNDANSNELNELSSNYHQTLKELKESKPIIESKQLIESKQFIESKQLIESKELKELKSQKELKELKSQKELKELKSQKELKVSKELKEPKEEPLLVRCNTLQQKLIDQEQLSRNTISRQTNSKFEQINAQIVDIHQHSSNAHLQSNVETPAFFNFEQTNNNYDPWGMLANAWPMNIASSSRIEAIEEIKEEPDLQHRQSRRQSELVPNYDKLNQSKQIGDVIEEEPESSQVIRSPSLSRQSSEKLQIPELKLNSNFIESHLKAYDTLLTEPMIQKNLFDNFLVAEKPVSIRKILNSGIFTQTALEEISTEHKQIEIQKPAVENEAKKRPVAVPMLSIPSFRNMDFSNLPSSPLLNNAPSPILNRYSFAPITPPQEVSINNESKSKLSSFIGDQKQKKKKATQILRQIYRKQPELFEQALQQLVAKVITEPQASLFFTEYVRIFNPSSTKDRLLKLYRHIDDSQQHRNMLVNALKQFKLQQIPTMCLNFNKNLVGIFRVIYPEVYIEDILAPNIKLYEAFLESYFSKKFDRTSIKIQDEIIELAYPRNILNVLLFLNEYLRLPIEQVFEAYTKKMMKYGQIDIIKKIINSHIPSVCKIDVSIFTKAAQSIAKEILIQNHTASPHLESIIDMMDLKNQHIFKLTIELIEEFNLCEIVFDIHALLELPHSNSSFNVLKELIKANSAYSLGKLQLPQILKKLIWLQKGKKEYYYSEQGVQITKILVVKLLNKQLYSQALNNLIPVAVGLKRSYLAAILINHFQGRFANRLANVKINGPCDFTKIFKDLIHDPQSKGDKIPSDINSRGMKWQEFRSLCKEVLKLDIWELCYIIYTDHELAYQLTEQSIIKQSQLSQLYKALGNQSSKYKYMKFLNQKQQFLQIPLGSETSQEGHSEELRLTVPHEKEYKRKKKFDLSFKEINSLDSVQFSKQKLCRSLLQNDNQTDPVLFDLKFTVSSEQLAQVLRQHYQKSSIQQFLQALKVVDKQELGIIIQNVQIFKSVYNLHIDIDLKELIPFEYFFNLQKAWVIAKPYIKKQVTTDNFWMYFLAVDIIYSKNQQLIEFLIDKLILEGNDEWAAAVEQILKQIEVRKQFLEDKINQAQQNQMYELKRVLDLNFVKVQSNR